MVRTTIMLPLPLKRRVELRAKRERKSLGRFIRESLERSVSNESAGQPRLADPLFADDVTFDDDLPSDLAEHHDQYLLSVLQEEHPARRRSGSGRSRRRTGQ